VLAGGEAEAGFLAAVAGDWAGDVVVAEHPGCRRADRGMRSQGLVDHRPQGACFPGTAEEFEVEGAVHLVGAQVRGEALLVGEPDFTDQGPVAGVGVGYRAPFLVDLVDAVEVGVGVFV
jgi:hypothetical protein